MQRNLKNQNEKHLVEFVCKFRPKNIWKAWRIGNSGGSTQARKKEREEVSIILHRARN